MKQLLLAIQAFLLVTFFLPVAARACDICGCGVGNDYIGILPEFHKHIFGVRYRHNTLFTHMGVGGQNTYLTTKESYNTVAAWGGCNVTDKFRVMAVVPFSFNQRENQGATRSKSGVGDATLAAYYQLLNNRRSAGNRLLVQSLWIGGGVKLAPGAYYPAGKRENGGSAHLF